jgi:hypothetical protein
MLKRDLRLFVRCLIPAAVLTAVFAAVCAAAAFSGISAAGSGFSPVKTAVVDGDDSTLSRIVLRTVAGTDYISQLLDVTVCTEEEAMSGLEAGEFSAVILLPEGTVDGILHGWPTKGTIYLSAAAAAHTEVVARTAAFGEVMLAAGQYGIFSGEQLIRDSRLDGEFRKEFLTRYNALLLAEAFQANSQYFDIHITDYAGTKMDTAAYYLVCWLTLLMALVPMLFSGLYAGDLNRPMLCRLRGLGVSDGAFLLGKFLLPFGFMAVLGAACLWGIGALVPVEVSFVTVAFGLLAAALAAMLGGSVMLWTHNGATVVVSASLGGLLLCGGLIPRQTLPQALLRVGTLTPFGAVQNLLAPVFGGEIDLYSLLAAVIYTALGLYLAKRRLLRIRIGGDAV